MSSKPFVSLNGVGISLPVHPLSRLERLLTHDKTVRPLSEIENIIVQGKYYTGPVTSRVSYFLLEYFKDGGDTDWVYEPMYDSYGDYIRDSNGDIIMIRVKKTDFYTDSFGDSYGTDVLDDKNDKILGRIAA